MIIFVEMSCFDCLSFLQRVFFTFFLQYFTDLSMVDLVSERLEY